MQTDPVLIDRARRMRREMTEPEIRLWLTLRGRRFAGVKFNRQVVVGGHVADFCARSHKLVIEVDGDTHSDQARDGVRTAALEKQGFRVIRFANAEVMGNLEGVLAAIGVALGETSAPLPTLSPEGRGLEL